MHLVNCHKKAAKVASSAVEILYKDAWVYRCRPLSAFKT